jgi:phosphatidylserine/phosphatidylglycerophosphate/cardiolipin synthase-like enzyme
MVVVPIRRRRVKDVNRRHLALAMVAMVVILLVAVFYAKMVPPPGMPAEVAPADSRDYFPVVHDLLAGARHSIDVVLYQSRFYFEYPLSASNTLIADLVDAAERGVKVRAVIEIADWNYENSEDNRDVWSVLRGAGVETYFDPAETTSHSKLVIVDGRYTVMGSTNWSYYALDKNNEATVVVDSDGIAEDFTAYFDEIVAASTRDYALPVEYLPAARVSTEKRDRIFLVDVADSGRLVPAEKVGWIYFGKVAVRVDEDALNEILAVDSLFFEGVAGDSVRVFGEVHPDRKGEVHALDVETPASTVAMAAAFQAERQELKARAAAAASASGAGAGSAKGGSGTRALPWVRAARVVPIPNRAYAPEVERLIAAATERVWIAMLDARYYDKFPGPPEAAAARPKGAPPSLTNLILAGLEAAAHRGVDVRLVIDAGREGRMPAGKTAFIQRLREAGGTVVEDDPEVTTHAKVMIVDGYFTVLGSTNWSQPAVEENNETAVVIDSPEINRHYAEFIARVGRFAEDRAGETGGAK